MADKAAADTTQIGVGGRPRCRYVLYTDGNVLASQHVVANRLLHAMLPTAVLRQLKKNTFNGEQQVLADQFSEVTVLFCEVCNFRKISNTHNYNPDVCVKALNIIYSRFDLLIPRFKVHKVRR